MKYKTTAKEVRNRSYRPIAISYCGAQHLLWGHSADAYTCGVYGWNFDVYELNNATICTGYRGMVGITPDYDTLRKLEDKAKKIVNNYDLSYQQKQKKLDKLLEKLVSSVYPV